MKFRELSESSVAKLAKLDTKPSFWSAIYKDSDPRIEIVNDLGSSAEAALVPWLVRYALDPRAVLQVAARVAISKLMASIPLDRLVEIDALARESFEYWDYRQVSWGKFTVGDVSRLSRAEDAGLLAFASMNPDGRVREAALRLLAASDDGSELPFILIRANDWVEPIRMLVRELVLDRLRPSYAMHFLGCLPLVLQLQRCGRAKHRWMLDSVGDLLRQDECFAVLQGGLRSEDGKVRRRCLQLLTAKDSADVRSELVLALGDQDPMNRLLAVQCLLAFKDRSLFATVWEEMREDSFMPLRREALYARVQVGGDDLQADLVAALLDRHPSMRSAALFFLGKEFDAASYYRTSLNKATGWKLVAAIRGLGESGVDVDADTLGQFLYSPEIRLRKASIISIASLAALRYRDQLLTALQDASSGVSFTACIALRSISALLDVRELESLIQESPLPHVRKNVLRISQRLNKWEQVILVILASRDDSEAVSGYAASIARRWFDQYNKNFLKPTDDQVTRVEQALNLSRNFLTVKEVAEFEHILRIWR